MLYEGNECACCGWSVMCMYMYVCICVWVCKCMRMYICMCGQLCSSVCLWVCKCVCRQAYTYRKGVKFRDDERFPFDCSQEMKWKFRAFIGIWFIVRCFINCINWAKWCVKCVVLCIHVSSVDCWYVCFELLSVFNDCW